MSQVLQGKVAIVTGAGRGIGQAFAAGLAEAGADVVVADIGDTAETAGRIEAAGQRALQVHCDVTDTASVEAMVAQTQRDLGRIDVLVNNAGAYPFAPIEATDEAFLQRIMALNVYGVFHCIRNVVPIMKAQGSGKIISISSATIWGGAPMASAYVATKGAVIGLTRALARELGPDNIQVNALTPGLTETPGVKEAEMISDDFYDLLVQGQCFQRRERAEDMVGTIVFLASSGSDFMTGQALNVDGGWCMH